MRQALLFVGEKPSLTAHRKTWTWESGRLAAKPLFEALREIDITPETCGFVNLYGDSAFSQISHASVTARSRAVVLKAAHKAGARVIAMGNKVSITLHGFDVPHIKLRHPAARGAGRKSEKYRKHVRDTLMDALWITRNDLLIKPNSWPKS